MVFIIVMKKQYTLFGISFAVTFGILVYGFQAVYSGIREFGSRLGCHFPGN